MTPAARVQAAIEVLDDFLNGAAVEQCLTAWARRSRFAGSGDRAAVRDLVFDAIRCKRSYGWLGGQETGRSLMLGHCRAEQREPGGIFTGVGHAPAQLAPSETEATPDLTTAPAPVRLDCQDWLWPVFQGSLGDTAEDVLAMMRTRAAVFLRANTLKTTRNEAIARLAEDGVEAEIGPLSETAIMVTGHPRRIRKSAAFTQGLIEFQDAASQAVVDTVLAHVSGGRVLDYCAGGGGKALHLAAAGVSEVIAHDAAPERMKDIPERAYRAGVSIVQTERPEGVFDCVLTDVPCSGSGAWRRQPEAKWRLTAERLVELQGIQDSILDRATEHVRPGGLLAYATCSVLADENDTRIASFLQRHDGWTHLLSRQFSPLEGGDGFFVGLCQKP